MTQDLSEAIWQARLELAQAAFDSFGTEMVVEPLSEVDEPPVQPAVVSSEPQRAVPVWSPVMGSSGRKRRYARSPRRTKISDEARVLSAVVCCEREAVEEEPTGHGLDCPLAEGALNA